MYPPKIYDLGLRFDPGGARQQRIFEIGGHHTAGPTPKTDAQAKILVRAYHEDHRRNRGWIGLGYNFVITPKGNIIEGRPLGIVPAAVEGFNTGRIHVAFLANNRKPTKAERRAFQWLRRNLHRSKRFSPSHRLDYSIAGMPRKGHREYPGHGSNDCPGRHLGLIHRGY